MPYCRFKSMDEVKVGALINFRVYGEWQNGLIVDFKLPDNLPPSLWPYGQYPCYSVLFNDGKVWMSFKEIKYTSFEIWKTLKNKED